MRAKRWRPSYETAVKYTNDHGTWVHFQMGSLPPLRQGVAEVARRNEQSSWGLPALFSCDCQDIHPPGSVTRRSEHGWMKLNMDKQNHLTVQYALQRQKPRGQEHWTSPWASDCDAWLFEDLLTSFSVRKAHLSCLSLQQRCPKHMTTNGHVSTNSKELMGNWPKMEGPQKGTAWSWYKKIYFGL